MNNGPGDRISFQLVAGGLVEMRPLTVDLRSLAGMVVSNRKGVTLADMDRAVAEGAAGSGLDKSRG